MGVGIGPASEWIAGTRTRRAMWILLGAVALLLLIACVNLANLLLARAAGRTREMAVRSGAGRRAAAHRGIGVTESCLLCFGGAGLGLLRAWLSVAALKASETNSIPRLTELDLNGYVLGFTLLVSMLTGFASGLAPALQSPSLRDQPEPGGRQRSRDWDRWHARRRRSSFVPDAAGRRRAPHAQLLAASLTGVERGFDTRQRLFFSVSLPDRYPAHSVGRLAAQFLERVQALPYVKSAAVVSQRPLGQGNTGLGFGAPGQERADRDVPWASWRLISPDYFKALGMPIPAPVEPSSRRRAGTAAEGPVVVSRRVADMLYPNQDPVGRPITLWKGSSSRGASSAWWPTCVSAGSIRSLLSRCICRARVLAGSPGNMWCIPASRRCRRIRHSGPSWPR